MRVVAVHEERHIVCRQQLHPVLEVIHVNTVSLWRRGRERQREREREENEREGARVMILTFLRLRMEAPSVSTAPLYLSPVPGLCSQHTTHYTTIPTAIAPPSEGTGGQRGI